MYCRYFSLTPPDRRSWQRAAASKMRTRPAGSGFMASAGSSRLRVFRPANEFVPRLKTRHGCAEVGYPGLRSGSVIRAQRHRPVFEDCGLRRSDGGPHTRQTRLPLCVHSPISPSVQRAAQAPVEARLRLSARKVEAKTPTCDALFLLFTKASLRSPAGCRVSHEAGAVFTLPKTGGDNPWPE